MAYIVKAPLVIAKTDEGSDIYLYQGATVPDDQPEEWTHIDHPDGTVTVLSWVEAHLADGSIAEAGASDDDGTPRRRSRRAAAEES